MIARGYAAVNEKGAINVQTVSQSERGAKVNALVLIGGVTPLNGCPDHMIDSLFDTYVDPTGWRVAPVAISLVNLN